MDAADSADQGQRYLKPKSSTNAFNTAVGFLTRHGISILGSRVLQVRGRKSGKVYSLPVNPLPLDGERYLISPRGHTQWVRNMRAAGGGELRVGRRVERFTAVELADEEKPAVLHEYIRRWWFEVGAFFEGVNRKTPEAELLRIAPGFPVFRITTTVD